MNLQKNRKNGFRENNNFVRKNKWKPEIKMIEVKKDLDGKIPLKTKIAIKGKNKI